APARSSGLAGLDKACPDRDHAASVGDLRRAAETYEALAEQARAGFALFWNEKTGYCCDVLDGPGGNDPALRRNQLFAVSLPNAPRGCIAQAWSVAEVLRVWREIGWTTGSLWGQAPGRPAGGIRDVD
ncbi:MAG TPA: amylo-alpha-1,6-glucosidase, partial [Anaerolineae bacterium]|nr:amylo-alpha-1,6-glucosidase [Anaerolineae bacterium]